MPQFTEPCSYIANRLFCYVTCIPVRPHQLYEDIFFDLMDFVNAFVRTPGAMEVCQQIHGGSVSSLDDLLIDTKNIFEGIIDELGTINNPLAVRTLFVATYILMMKNERDTRKCAHLAFWFDEFVYRSRGWSVLINHALHTSRDHRV